MGAIPIYGESGRQIGWQTTKDNSGSSGTKQVYSYSKNKGSTDPTTNGISKVTYKPTTKKTTATTKDGKSYTFDGDNWIDYAKNNGLDAGSLATAISYPSYVDNKEANRFINEQADRYGVSLNTPTGAYESAISKEYASKNNSIPDYSSPFASAAAGQTQTSNSLTNGLNNSALTAYGISAPEYQSFDYSTYYDKAAQSYQDSVEAQRLAAIKALEEAAKTTNQQYDDAAQQAYLANYFANKATGRQLKESGIKGGLTESSLLAGNANFENAYNQNEAARIAALRENALQQSQTNAQYDADINAYLAQLALSEAQAAQNEIANINSFNYNNYLTALDQLANDRNYELALKELERTQSDTEYDRLMDGINLAYQLGDVERLKELGYYTDSVASEIAANIAANNASKAKNTASGYNSYSGSSSSDENANKNSTAKTSSNDGYVTNGVNTVRNGDGELIEVMNVGGRNYSVDAVKAAIKKGTMYITADGTVKLKQ